MKAVKTTFLYTLSDPETGKIRYIGKSDNPFKRYPYHIWDKEDTYKTRWISGLKTRGLKPTMDLLDEVPDTQWQFWEREYIRVFRAIGMNLVNTTDGGDGIQMPRTTEHNKRIGLAHKGKKLSFLHCLAIGKSKRGQAASALQKRVASEVNSHPKSEQTKHNMREGWILRRLPHFSDGGGI